MFLSASYIQGFYSSGQKIILLIFCLLFTVSLRAVRSAEEIKSVKADQILDNVSASERNAEWYFLKGTICHRRGWLNEAYNNFTRAVQLDPNNMEYQSVLAQMNRQRSGYMSGNPTQGYRAGGMSGPDCCSSLCCADCCCEMMGGDLIPCC